MKKTKITINEIADRAGVSIATVSRIINGKKNVKSETEQYVLSIIAQLEQEYGLDTKFTSNRGKPIILSIADFDAPILNDFSTGVQRVLTNREYHLVTIDYSKHRVDLLSEISFLSQNIPLSGIMMLNNYENASDIASLATRFPVVTAYTSSEHEKIASITIDDYGSGQTIANHLLSLGCQNIVILSINDTVAFSRLRKNGILNALAQAKIQVPDYNQIHLPSFNTDVAASMIRQRINSQGKPDAIIGVNDALAAIAMRESKHLGFRIPEDILVAGFDNAEIACLVEPNLTTIHSKAYDIGAQAANMLLDMLNNPNIPAQHITLHGELIVRESTLK